MRCFRIEAALSQTALLLITKTRVSEFAVHHVRKEIETISFFSLPFFGYAIRQQMIRECKRIYGKRIAKKLYFGNNVCILGEIKNSIQVKQQTQNNELYPVTVNYPENKVSPSEGQLSKISPGYAIFLKISSPAQGRMRKILHLCIICVLKKIRVSLYARASTSSVFSLTVLFFFQKTNKYKLQLVFHKFEVFSSPVQSWVIGG
jgi:hypothetical protein